jgi:hypothetical protein
MFADYPSDNYLKDDVYFSVVFIVSGLIFDQRPHKIGSVRAGKNPARLVCHISLPRNAWLLKGSSHVRALMKKDMQDVFEKFLATALRYGYVKDKDKLIDDFGTAMAKLCR